MSMFSLLEDIKQVCHRFRLPICPIFCTSYKFIIARISHAVWCLPCVIFFPMLFRLTGSFSRPRNSNAHFCLKIENYTVVFFTFSHKLNKKAMSPIETRLLKPRDVEICSAFDIRAETICAMQQNVQRWRGHHFHLRNVRLVNDVNKVVEERHNWQWRNDTCVDEVGQETNLRRQHKQHILTSCLLLLTVIGWWVRH